MKETPPIPDIFHLRKSKILADLSTPESDYADLSPKGSVDEAIRGLIGDINALPGLVTTSSCAGRISVFLEGRRATQAQSQNLAQEESQPQPEPERQFAPSGGKGAGKWLYVSHDPLNHKETSDSGSLSLHSLFGLVEGDGKIPGSNRSPRLVRFIFEPMILHIMTASLNHAQPVLAASSSSGFRESGLQSLRCVDDDGVSPIVAVRSSGLALESIIGYAEDDSPDLGSSNGEPTIRSLVSEEYLQMLVDISNERFEVNTQRKERFRTLLLDMCSRDSGGKPAGWEDPGERKERKRAEGLRRQREMQEDSKRSEYESDPGDISDSDDELGSFF